MIVPSMQPAIKIIALTPSAQTVLETDPHHFAGACADSLWPLLCSEAAGAVVVRATSQSEVDSWETVQLLLRWVQL